MFIHVPKQTIDKRPYFTQKNGEWQICVDFPSTFENTGYWSNGAIPFVIWRSCDAILCTRLKKRFVRSGCKHRVSLPVGITMLDLTKIFYQVLDMDVSLWSLEIVRRTMNGPQLTLCLDRKENALLLKMSL